MFDFTPILEDVALTLVSVVLAVLGTFVVKWVKALAAKAGVSLDAQREAFLDAKVQALILQIEEESAARIRAGLPKIAGGEKFQRVLISLIDKLPGITREKAEELIQSNLPKIGVGALAAQEVEGKK